MSLRTNSLREYIRDLTGRPDGSDADDQARRGTVGREVLQALAEIDRIARATPGATRAPGGAAAGTAAPLSALAVAVYGVTDVRGGTAGATAQLIAAATSVRLTGRQMRRA